MSFNDELDDVFSFLIDEPPGPEWRFMEGERRDVAVLFADIHGFTDMSRRLDPEVVHLKMNELLKLFTKCTHYYGGYVDKYTGDGIMCLFGAKKASEQDSERAVLAGLKMLQNLRLFNSLLATQPRFQEIQLSVRIGINTGLVSVGKVGDSREGDFTVYGDAVNLASRMESNAPENRVMVSDATRQALERYFDFESAGCKNIKGYTEAVDCYLVKGPKAQRQQRWSLRKTPYTGRRMELDLLQNQLQLKIQEASEKTYSNSVIIRITADAGMGKSRLLYEAISPFRNQIVYLPAVASATNPAPLGLFCNLLENWLQLGGYLPTSEKHSRLETAISKLKEEIPTAMAGELDEALPLLAFLLEIPSPDPRLKQRGKDLILHIQQALLSFLRAMLARASQHKQALILSWDDLHWADETSILILEFLYKALASFPDSSLLSFMLYRDWDCPEAFLSGIGFTHSLALEALSEDEIESLIRAQAGELEIPPETIAKVKELSAGNPFYLEEWCNYLNELPHYEARDFPVPTNLHALVLSRLDRLTDSVRLLLQKAAVIGQEFLLEILEEIEQRLQNPLDLNQTLSHLQDQALILKMLGFDYSVYFFKHITTRDVAYQTLLHINRRMLHQLTAEAIEKIFPDRLDEFLYSLAEHYRRAEISDKAIHYLEKAAASAARSYSNHQALCYYDHLLELIPESEPEKITPILLQKAEILWLTGHYTESDELLEQASNLIGENNSSQRFESLRQKGIHCFTRGDATTALECFELCLALTEVEAASLEKDTWLTIAHGNLGIWHQHHKDYERGLKHHRLSLDFNSRIDDPQREARTLSNLGLIYLQRHDFQEADQAFHACLELSEKNQYLREKSIALGNLGVLHYKQGNFDQAMRYYEKKLPLVDKLDDKAELIKVLGNIANIHRDKGQHREALEYYQKTLSHKEATSNKKELAITHNAIANELRKLGSLSEALMELDKAIEYAVEYPSNLCEYLHNKADTLFSMNDLKKASEVNQRSLDIAEKVNKDSVRNACISLSETIQNLVVSNNPSIT